MKLFRGILFVAFGIFCLVAVYLFWSGSLEPPPGNTVGPGNYIFGLILGAAAILVGCWDIREALRRVPKDKGDKQGE